MSINIQVTSQSQQANADLTKFTADQLRNLAAYQAAASKASAASSGLAANVLDNNRKLKSAIGGLALNLSFLAGPAAQQWVYPLMLVQKELKGLKSAAAIAGVSMPAVALGIAGITAAAATGYFALQKYRAEMELITSQGDLAFTQGANRNRLFDLLDANKSRLKPGEAAALRQQLATGVTADAENLEKLKEALRTTKDTSPEGLQNIRDQFPLKLPEIEAGIRARLKEVVLNAEQLKQLDELRSKTADLHTEQLAGFNKERVEEEARFAKAKAFIEERGAAAKTEKDNNDVSLAYQENRILRETKLADIEKRETEAKLKSQKDFADAQRKIQEEEDDARLKEFGHVQQMREMERQRRIENVQADFRLTDAQKFTQLQGLGQSNLGPDPSSFGQNFTANLVQWQNQIGTFSQASAALVMNGIGSAINGIGDSIAGAILYTKNWAQVWSSVLTQMLGQAIQFGVNQLAAFVLTQGRELIFHVATEHAKTATTVKESTIRKGAALGEAGAEAVDAGAKGAGAVAGIPYIGPILAVAAFASIIGMIAAAASSARASGGPVSAGQPYLVGELGREMFVPKHDGFIVPNSKTEHLMIEDSRGDQPGVIYGGGGQTNVKTVIVWDYREAMREVMESPVGEKVIVQTIDGRRIDLGIPT